jgi:hypothetical protein
MKPLPFHFSSVPITDTAPKNHKKYLLSKNSSNIFVRQNEPQENCLSGVSLNANGYARLILVCEPKKFDLALKLQDFQHEA